MGKEERKKTMKIAALYDIHGNLPALEAVLNEIDREGVDVDCHRWRYSAWAYVTRRT